MKKRLAALFIILVTVFVMLPFSAPVAHAVDVIDTEDVLEVRDALRRDGNVEININADLYYKLPPEFSWDAADSDGVKAWVVVGQGTKTINLKAHSLTVDDDFVTTAVIKKETQYVAGEGEKEVYAVQYNKYVRNAVMFRVREGAELVINGKGGEIEMIAQLPAKSQLQATEMMMKRDLFDVCGGSLQINGGTYQAGRRKEIYVSLANDCEYNYGTGYAVKSMPYSGSAEHAIGGSVLKMSGGSATITSGTFTGHGLFYRSRSLYANAVIEASGGKLRIYDGTFKAVSGADVFHVEEGDCAVSAVIGEFTTEAPKKYVFPEEQGHKIGVYACERGMIGLPYESFMLGDFVYQSGDNYYDPYYFGDTVVDLNRTFTAGKVIWAEDKTDTEKDFIPGSGKKVGYSLLSELGYITDEIAALDGVYGVEVKVNLVFSLMRKQSDGKWKSVIDGGVKTGVADQSLDSLYDNWKEGETYRVSVKASLEWTGTHHCEFEVKAQNSLVFTVKAAKTINQVDLEIDTKEGALINSQSVTTATEGVESVNSKWYVDGVETVSTKFGTGAYQAKITVVAKEGFKFTQDTKFYLRGIALTPSISGATGRVATFMSPTFYGVCSHGSKSEWEADTEKHCKYCTTCGQIVDSGAHQYDAGTESGGKITYTCKVCGYQNVKQNGKIAIYEVVSDMEPVVFGQPLPAPSIRPDYAKRVTIKSYTWYKDNTKISDTSIAEKGWYSLVLSVTADDGYYFESGAKVLNPYYPIDAVSNTDKVISTTLRVYVKEISTASVDIPKLSPDKTVGEFLDQITVQVDNSKKILIRRFDIGWDGGAFILKRTSDGKWSVDANDASDMTINQIRAIRIEPNTEYTFELLFTSNTYYIPDGNIKFTAHSYEIGHTVEGGDENCLVRFRLVSDDNVIRSVDIKGVTPPEVGKKGSTAFSFYDSDRIDGGVAEWNYSGAFKCGEAYTFTAILDPVFGYEFSKDATASVNGMEASIEINGKRATVTYTFPAIEHKYGEMFTIMPSCEEDGFTERICTVCSARETITLPATGHDFYKVDLVPSTCMTQGVDEHYLCRGCYMCFDKNKNEKTEDALKLPLDPNNHEGGELGCDENGHYILCVCGAKLNEGAHTYGEWTVVKPATEEEEGERARECTECGYSQTMTIAKQQPGHEHKYVLKYGEEYHWNECACGDIGEKAAHTFGADNKCTVCGYEKGAAIPEETESPGPGSVTAENPEDTKDAATKDGGKPGGGNKSLIPLLIVIIVLLVAAAAVIIILAAKLKKKNKEEKPKT